MDNWPDDISTSGLFKYTFGEISIWPYMHAMSNYFVYMYLRDWSFSLLFALVWELYEVLVYMLYEYDNPNFELETPFASYVGDGFQCIVSVIVAQVLCSCFYIRRPLFLGNREPLPPSTYNNADTINGVLCQAVHSLIHLRQTYKSPPGSASRRYLKFILYIILFVVANQAVQLDLNRPHWFVITMMMLNYLCAGLIFHLILIPDLTALHWSPGEQLSFWLLAQFIPTVVWGLLSIQNAFSSYLLLWLTDGVFIIGGLIYFCMRGKHLRRRKSENLAWYRASDEAAARSLAGQALLRKAVQGWGEDILCALAAKRRAMLGEPSEPSDAITVAGPAGVSRGHREWSDSETFESLEVI